MDMFNVSQTIPHESDSNPTLNIQHSMTPRELLAAVNARLAADLRAMPDDELLAYGAARKLTLPCVDMARGAAAVHAGGEAVR